uniref:Cupiennin-2e n=1 Tax=Cupiennius salei TaxID=6928 RepID=TXC2E_CUPSA|nr:RecName: Full=Cupiennin-2e; Short=Cu-2e [Cupiennius salei]
AFGTILKALAKIAAKAVKKLATKPGATYMLKQNLE